MTKIRRGNYIFISWKGDHSPKHLRVYYQGRLKVKWDLENNKPMEGKANRRILKIIKDLLAEGYYED